MRKKRIGEYFRRVWIMMKWNESRCECMGPNVNAPIFIPTMFDEHIFDSRKFILKYPRRMLSACAWTFRCVVYLFAHRVCLYSKHRPFTPIFYMICSSFLIQTKKGSASDFDFVHFYFSVWQQQKNKCHVAINSFCYWLIFFVDKFNYFILTQILFLSLFFPTSRSTKQRHFEHFFK